MTPLEADLSAVVQSAIDNHPRSLQKRVGPSELHRKVVMPNV